MGYLRMLSRFVVSFFEFAVEHKEEKNRRQLENKQAQGLLYVYVLQSHDSIKPSLTEVQTLPHTLALLHHIMK